MATIMREKNQLKEKIGILFHVMMIFIEDWVPLKVYNHIQTKINSIIMKNQVDQQFFATFPHNIPNFQSFILGINILTSILDCV
jgi:hypothetical protein